MTMTARQAFEKGTATFNAHDIGGFAEVLADNVVFTAPGGMQGEGKQACAAFFGGWFDGLPGCARRRPGRSLHRRRRGRGGYVLRDAKGVLRGPAGDIPATGRPVELDYIQVLRFRDGKHISFNLMFDRLMMLEQLGLVPTPALAG